jgi:hypothetical protein
MLANLTRRPAKREPDIAIPAIPARPKEIDAANDALAKARVVRQAAQQRHVDAVDVLARQKAGEPVTMTVAEVDRIGIEIARAIEAERVHKAEADRLNNAFRAKVLDDIAEPMQLITARITDHFEQIDALLAQLETLSMHARAARVELPHKLPGSASLLRGLLSPVRKSFQRVS